MKINRRSFIKRSGGAAAISMCSLGIPLTSASTNAVPLFRQTLSSSISELKSDWQVLVIGSGYGGSIMAAKLSEYFEVAILERGKEWKAGDFPDTFANTASQIKSVINPLGLVDFTIGDDVDVLSGSGLGGTSLINANVLISPDDSHFNSYDWPTAIRRDNINGKLQQHRDAVLSVLAPEQVSTSKQRAKQRHMISSATHLQEKGEAIEIDNLQLAVNVVGNDNESNPQGVKMNQCTQCGDCVTGCNVGAKKTLDTNYLPIAKNNGAKIFTQCLVDTVEKITDGSYRVIGRYISHNSEESPFILSADKVIVAAGSLGSTGLLMRSEQQGNLDFSSKLGDCFSGNSDVLGMNYNQKIDAQIEGHGIHSPPNEQYKVGPTLTTGVHHLNGPNGKLLIEEGAMPRALVNTMRYAAAIAAPSSSVPKNQRVALDLTLAGEGGAISHSMIYLGMGKEVSQGKIKLDSHGNPKVVWPGALSDPTISALREAMGQHTQVFDGQMIDNPRSEWLGGKNLVTVHPLGGCKMANYVGQGVANHKGQVFSSSGGIHDGLYVCDGAILPGAVGVNPMLVISSLADRIADHFIQDNQ